MDRKRLFSRRKDKKPAAERGGSGKAGIRPCGAPEACTPHLCQVRFWWRCDFKRFRRLCLFIFRRRFFFRLPMVVYSVVKVESRTTCGAGAALSSPF